MKNLTLSVAMIAALFGCAATDVSKSIPMEVAQSDEQRASASAARWVIVAYEGRGIPGSPGAQTVLPDARNFLQHVVDSCELGRTVLMIATDGVIILHITNNNLTDEQLRCLRAFERPGLIVTER